MSIDTSTDRRLPFVWIYGADGVGQSATTWEINMQVGLQIRSCVEPRLGYPIVDPDDKPAADPVPPNTPPDIWALHSWAAAATNAAYRNQPVAIIWHFQLTGP